MLVIPIGDVNPNRRLPFVNYFLIGVNVIIFLAFSFGSDYQNIIRLFGFIPEHHVWWTYLSSQFLHADVWHLLGNMLFLWIFGDNIEETFGSLWYFILYLGAGSVAVFFHLHMVGSDYAMVPCIGASGAISGIMGSYAVLFPRHRIVYWYFFFFRMGTFRVSAGWAIGYWFVLQLISHIFGGAEAGGVAVGAHMGGFICGAVATAFLLITGIFKRPDEPPDEPW